MSNKVSELDLNKLDYNESPVLQSPRAMSIHVDLEVRRKLERNLIMQYDTAHIEHRQVWFMIDMKWIENWTKFVGQQASPPGSLSNKELYSGEILKENLQISRDYRAVNPQVYALFVEIYGTLDKDPIARWVLDLYAHPVSPDEWKESLKLPRLQARVAVREMWYTFDQWPEPASQEESCWYKCCCRCNCLLQILARLFEGPTYAKVSQSESSFKKNVEKEQLLLNVQD